jgi:hypothetical protein
MDIPMVRIGSFEFDVQQQELKTYCESVGTGLLDFGLGCNICKRNRFITS